MPTYQVYCPCCGRIAPSSLWHRVPLFGSKPFGVVMQGLGRGKGFRVIGSLSIQDCPGIFEIIKLRTLGLLAYWYAKGLISKSDIDDAFGIPKIVEEDREHYARSTLMFAAMLDQHRKARDVDCWDWVGGKKN